MPEICLLGTGGMMPLKDRWLTSCYIGHNGRAVLIDCGEGTQIALAEQGKKISRIDTVLITHCHADHVSGLAGFLLSMGNSSRTQPLDIFLPEGKTPMIKNILCICDRLPFEVNFHELSLSGKTEFSCAQIDTMLKISSLPLRHSTDCLGYSLSFGKKAEFLPERAKALDIPVKYWKALHCGETVILDDGREVSGAQVTGSPRKPVKITYVTDTLPFNGIADFAFGSDLFICEGMYGDETKKQSMDKKGHMLMQDACKLAEIAECKRLWLTHYSPAEKDPEEYAHKLRLIFPNVTVSRDGQCCELC